MEPLTRKEKKFLDLALTRAYYAAQDEGNEEGMEMANEIGDKLDLEVDD